MYPFRGDHRYNFVLKVFWQSDWNSFWLLLVLHLKQERGCRLPIPCWSYTKTGTRVRFLHEANWLGSCKRKGSADAQGDKIIWSDRWHYIKGLILSVILVASRKVSGLWQKFGVLWHLDYSIYSSIPTQWQSLRRDSNSFGWELHVNLRVLCL